MIAVLRRSKRDADQEPEEAGSEQTSVGETAEDESSVASRPWWRRAGSPGDGGHGWTYGASLQTRAVSLVVAAALLAGPAALVLQVRSSPAPVQQAAGMDSRLMSRRTAATDVASRWVRAWLSTPRERAAELDAWMTLDARTRDQLPVRAVSVGQVDVRDAVATSPGVWVVTVAAQLPGSAQGTQTRFFVVPVAVAGQERTSAQPLSLPAEVADPGSRVSQKLDYAVPVAVGAGPWSTTAGFLTALLTGQAEISRYTSPGSPLGRIDPPAWSTARVVALSAASPVATNPADGAVLQVLATVQVTAPASAPASSTAPATPPPAGPSSTSSAPGSTSTPPSPTAAVTGPYALQYVLTLTARAGRWEVSQMNVPNAPAPRAPAHTP